jgi:NADPH2:quinone reductase
VRTTAARLVEHGKPIRVEEVELAEPGDGEVVVEMAFAGVNPVDRYGALGRVAPDGPLPRTLGGEGAGFFEGKAYVVHGAGLGSQRDGLWARHAVVPKAALVPVPDGVDVEKAAAMGVAGVTAWRTVVDIAAVQPEDKVLVLGASGGVGHVMVSLLAGIGARVWGQAGSEAKAGFVRDRGAERVIVGDAEAVGREARDLAPSVVFDPLGDGFTGAAIETLEPRGRLVIYGTSADASGSIPLQALYRKGLSVYGYAGLIEPAERLRQALVKCLAALGDGRLDVVVDSALPLGEVNQAFERLVGRDVRGKLVLDLRK